MSLSSYRKLDVWQRAMDLVVECYNASKKFPREERYGLTSQLQRAAVSVPANISEGQGREHRKEFLHHLSIAHGSLAELETHLQIAERLNYLNSEEVQGLLTRSEEIGRMINGLRKSLRQDKQ
jgi:four helix bundle protein